MAVNAYVRDGLIVPKWNIREVERMMNIQFFEVLHDRIMAAFEKAGIEGVNEAVTSGSYTNRTGNLRNSVGYIIGIDGKVAAEFYKNDYGSEYGKKILEDYPTGIVLIVYAGMNYAAAVESKGYTVLSSAELLVEKRLPEILKTLSK